MNIKNIKLSVFMIFMQRMLDAFNLNEIVELFVKSSARNLKVFSLRDVGHGLVFVFKQFDAVLIFKVKNLN